MSSDQENQLCELVQNLIPVVKKRVLLAIDHSREDVEYELATLANLLTIRNLMECN